MPETNAQQRKKLLALIRAEQNPLRRRLVFLGVLSLLMRRRGATAPPCVVGGTVVEFYTRGRYSTGDVDLLSKDQTELRLALEDLGFSSVGVGGRNWYSDLLDMHVDFLGSGPPEIGSGGPVLQVRRIAVGEISKRGNQGESLRKFRSGMQFDILRIEDIILDRLCAAVYWKSQDDAFWAEVLFHIGKEGEEPLDEEYLRFRLAAEDPAVRDLYDSWRESRKCDDDVKREDEGRGKSEG